MNGTGEYKQQGEPRQARGMQQLGSLFLLIGAFVILLTLIDINNGLTRVSMPRFWYVNRPIWYVSGVGFLVGGIMLMRRGANPPVSWKPSETGVRFKTLALYTRDGCHLCEDAEQLLVRYSEYLPPMVEVDIDTDPQWTEKFGSCVPVVEIDGKVRFRGRVSETLLRRLIEGTPPQ